MHQLKWNSSRGVQPFGISGPHWKKKSCLGPHIKYIATHNHTQKNLIMFEIHLQFCVGPHSQPSWAACSPQAAVRHAWWWICTSNSTMADPVLAICRIRSDKYLSFSNHFPMSHFTSTALIRRPHLRIYLSNITVTY